MADQQVPEQSAVVQQYETLRMQQQAIQRKLGELNNEMGEHDLVLDAIGKLEPERKCFRMVGGVLVERTVKEVKPAVTENRDGIMKICETYIGELKKIQTAMNEMESKYGLTGKEAAKNAAQAV